jgi:carboxymethylenebutenolidase
VHDNHGLTDHIRSVAGRLAASNFAALAIDLLSAEGGTGAFSDPAKATAALNAAPSGRLVADMKAGVDEMQRRSPEDRLGVVGFSFGGGLVWSLLAAGESRLHAAVPFYGLMSNNADLSGALPAAVFAIYGELDTEVNANQPAVEAALQKAGLTHEIITYPGVNHGFFNETDPRYNQTAAAAAYQRLTDWFAKYLDEA